MEPAHLGVILDSSILIEAERQRLDVARFLKLVTGRIGERVAALCAITAHHSFTTFRSGIRSKWRRLPVPTA